MLATAMKTRGDTSGTGLKRLVIKALAYLAADLLAKAPAHASAGSDGILSAAGRRGRTGPRTELIWIGLNCVAAILIGYLLATSFGRGLASPPARTIDNFAQLENVRLPVTTRSLRDLKSLVVGFKGKVDDFGRIYVNNRQVASTDDPNLPFKHITWQDHGTGRDEYISRFAVNRANPIDPEVEVREWLRKGTNWVMAELENTRWGACSMTVEVRANGTQVEGSPFFIPQREQTLREQTGAKLANAALVERFRKLSDETNALREFGIIPENDALCARLILVFHLD
jgi:hypothetical protein